jgi:hypothetical protein
MGDSSLETIGNLTEEDVDSINNTLSKTRYNHSYLHMFSIPHLKEAIDY